MNKKILATALLAFLLIGTSLIPTASVFAAEDTATSTDSEWITEDDNTNVDEDTYTDEDVDPALLEEYEQAMSYIDQLTPLQNYEDTAIDQLHQLGVLNASTRKHVYTKLNKTIIPNYTKFVKGMKKIKPENEELIAIHNKTIQAISLQLQGMTLIQKSVSTNKINLKTLNTGIDKLTKGSTMIDDVYDYFDTYVTKFQ
ncbi:hypothetical protein PQ456_02650 [Paenibacillus kyungheensis]|uniref:Uncharacterized protein n=1 Tax=Paenibacillus kyungheensis TaxID=1452732 RepID=A0AAX3M3H8_9BACL|nr:hypothetical protein [Paenibacillus kyungheensis]WCT56453.1 hypothetical protein PQ456_02650 [Paenibacillus kyungheensis]